MIKKTVLLCLLFVAFKNYAQQADKAESARLMDLYNKLEGTYQVQVINSRELPTIPLSLMDQVEQKRDASSVTYIWLASNVRVKVLPKTQINDPAFKKLERIVHIPSAD